jgi:5'-phosphate synthase pdxT subunit
VLAVCAGLVLAAREVTSPSQPSFGFLDISLARNAYGPQRHSFEATSDDGTLPLIFIRAPRITHVGSAVDVLATHRGEPVLVRQANVTGAAFHPELTVSRDVHRAVFGCNTADR